MQQQRGRQVEVVGTEVVEVADAVGELVVVFVVEAWAGAQVVTRVVV